MSKLEFNWLSPGKILCRIDGEDFFVGKIYVDDHVLASVSGECEIESSYTLHDGVLKARLSTKIEEKCRTSGTITSEEMLKAKERLTEYVKPPLGVKPCYVAVYGRIGELIDGIKRQLSSDKPETNLIKRWAAEIESLCYVIDLDSRFDEEKKMK